LLMRHHLPSGLRKFFLGDSTPMRLSKFSLVLLGANVNVLIAPPSPKRVLIAFAQGPAVACWVRDSPMTAASQGVYLPAGASPIFSMRIEDYGIMVKSPWYGWSSGATGSVMVIEVFEEE